MANKKENIKEIVRNVLRKAKLNIDPGDGTSDEVDEDELEEGFRKKKNRKYNRTS